MPNHPQSRFGQPDQWGQALADQSAWGTAERQRYQASRRPAPAAEPVRSHTGIKVILILLGLLLLVSSGALAFGAWKIHGSYPARVSLPDQLVGLAKLDDPQLRNGAEDVAAGLVTGAGVQNVLAGVYAKAGDAQHPVVVVVASGLFARPERQLLAGFTEFTSLGFAVATPGSIDAGTAGGYAKCAAGTLQPVTLSSSAPEADPSASASTPPPPSAAPVKVMLCGWADYGSMGIAGMINATDAASAANLIRSIRTTVATH